ncbi:MAG TPA: GAF domain-containing sensor histidine kinase [Candidatus Dormibacteraeota bacterium]|nr:GAF domain-containing sensor histidine kinase [Candidatus Dormibacteraeota bacterium]
MDASEGRQRPDEGTLTRAASSFPVLVVLQALDAWMREPSQERLTRFESALVDVMSSAGIRGAHLEIDAPPLPTVVLGQGSLAAWSPGADQDGLARFDLQAAEAGRRLGRLWLDADGPDAAVAARAVELALDAGWSRAAVAKTVERLEALDAATRAIASVLTLDRVLQLIVDRVRELAGARYAALGMMDERGQIERFLTSGIGEAERAAIGPPPRGLGLLGLLFREGRSIRIADIAADERSSGFPPGHPPMHSFLGVPILVKGRSVGNLYLTDKQGATEFSQADQDLVETFATHAGIAIDNARLHERIQRLVVVDERERIGRDLHDGIIQSLYAVGLSLEDVPELMAESPDEAAERVDRAIESINITIRDIRNFIFGLRPELLEQADLVASLTALADEFRLNTMIDIDVQVDPAAPVEVDPEERGHLLQIAREALSNIARHARATRAEILVGRGPAGDLVVEFADNGQGFDPDSVRTSNHQGLANMRGRARALGGTLSIESGAGAGTRIIVGMPLRDAASGADRA